MNVLDALSEVSGLSKAETEKIFETVKANIKRLNECSGPHDFEKVGEGFRAIYRCKKCAGEISQRDHGWYAKGLDHGKASK